MPDPNSADNRAARVIVIRLPDPDHDEIDRRAAARDIDPGDWVADLIKRELREVAA